MSLVEQELFTLPENLSSPPVFSGVRVVVCPSSIYGFWLPHWYRQTLLTPARILVFLLPIPSLLWTFYYTLFVRFSSLNKSYCNVVHSSLLCALICTRFLYNSCQYHLLKHILRRCLLNYQTFVNRIDGVMVSVLASSEVDHELEPRSGQTKDYTIGICCFSKHAALRRKSKDWLGRNQNDVSEWSDISTLSDIGSLSWFMMSCLCPLSFSIRHR